MLLWTHPSPKWHLDCFSHFCATICKTVRPMLSDHCLSVLSVTLVHCGQTVGWSTMKLGTKVNLGPGHIVLHWDPPTVNILNDIWICWAIFAGLAIIVIDLQTDRPTDHTTRSVTLGRIYVCSTVMRPKTTQRVKTAVNSIKKHEKQSQRKSNSQKLEWNWRDINQPVNVSWECSGRNRRVIVCKRLRFTFTVQ